MEAVYEPQQDTSDASFTLLDDPLAVANTTYRSNIRY